LNHQAILQTYQADVSLEAFHPLHQKLLIEDDTITITLFLEVVECFVVRWNLLL